MYFVWQFHYIVDTFSHTKCILHSYFHLLTNNYIFIPSIYDQNPIGIHVKDA